MKTHLIKAACVLFGGITLIAASSCSNTARGVVRDTEHNTAATGRGIKNVGHSIGKGVQHTGEKIGDAAR